MTKVLAAITTSIDGYIAGPNDGPGRGLGDGGERLHYWVFGGPWTYDTEPKGEPTGEGGPPGWPKRPAGLAPSLADAEPTKQPGTGAATTPGGCRSSSSLIAPTRSRRLEEFAFVSGIKAAVERAVDAAAGKDVQVMGGADIIRQALEAGLVDELTLIIAPVVLGDGKRLIDRYSDRSTSTPSRCASRNCRTRPFMDCGNKQTDGPR